MGRGCPAGHECCEKVEPPSQCLPVPPASWTGCLWLCQEPGDAHRVLESWQHPGHPASPLGLLCSPMDSERASVYEVSPLFRLSRALCGENKGT